MKTKGKQLVIFIPYTDKSTRKLGEDCVANGKELFENIKKCFANKKPVHFGDQLITNALLIYSNMSEKINLEEDSIVMLHAYGGEINGKLRDDNRGKVTVRETIKLVEDLLGSTTISELHFAVCYSALKGHIARKWKNKYPEYEVFGNEDEYEEDGIITTESNDQFLIDAKTAIKIMN